MLGMFYEKNIRSGQNHAKTLREVILTKKEFYHERKSLFPISVGYFDRAIIKKII